jgi:4'-phosphopantetheinyl transferase
VSCRNMNPGYGSSLRKDNIHIWFVNLSSLVEIESRFEQILSDDERLRAQRFYHINFRRLFTLSHGVLRTLLGHYLRVPAAGIILQRGHAGKPFLDSPGYEFQFNMAHSGDMAVYAFAIDCQIGIDIEQIRSLPDLDSIASKFFAREEYAELMSLDEPLRTAGFYNCWTRKEAYIKAIGDGLSLALDSFQVSLRPKEPAALLRPSEAAADCKAWRILDFSRDGYTAAVVFDDPKRAIHQWTCSSIEDIINL